MFYYFNVLLLYFVKICVFMVLSFTTIYVVYFTILIWGRTACFILFCF